MTTFAALFVPDSVRRTVADEAWLDAMLAAERALAKAGADAGIVPAEAAEAIAAACRADGLDLARLAVEGRGVGNPAEPLVRALRERVGGDAARWVHFGATSQDVVDTAAMLVARAAVDVVAAEVDAAAAAAARLAREHRETPMAARTLLQQAVPTTFGLTAAHWLVGLLDARDALRSLSFPAQLGGAAGTLAAFGERGPDVLRAYAAGLGLAEPPLPWHATRGPVRRLAYALADAASACEKPALDVVLLAQTELAEVAEGSGGGSSTMPHKRNPAQATLARACASAVRAQASLLVRGDHELQRAAGAWHAEWSALSEALALTGGAAAAVRASLEGLEVDAGRMSANMRDDLYAERDAFVERGVLAPGDDAYLGSAVALVDRALARAGDGS